MGNNDGHCDTELLNHRIAAGTDIPAECNTLKSIHHFILDFWTIKRIVTSLINWKIDGEMEALISPTDDHKLEMLEFFMKADN